MYFFKVTLFAALKAGFCLIILGFDYFGICLIILRFYAGFVWFCCCYFYLLFICYFICCYFSCSLTGSCDVKTLHVGAAQSSRVSYLL